jgi:hypothetical protein
VSILIRVHQSFFRKMSSMLKKFGYLTAAFYAISTIIALLALAKGTVFSILVGVLLLLLVGWAICRRVRAILAEAAPTKAAAPTAEPAQYGYPLSPLVSDSRWVSPAPAAAPVPPVPPAPPAPPAPPVVQTIYVPTAPTQDNTVFNLGLGMLVGAALAESLNSEAKAAPVTPIVPRREAEDPVVALPPIPASAVETDASRDFQILAPAVPAEGVALAPITADEVEAEAPTKSQIAQQITEQNSTTVTVVPLSTVDPEDLRGYPTPAAWEEVGEILPPISGDDLDQGIETTHPAQAEDAAGPIEGVALAPISSVEVEAHTEVAPVEEPAPEPEPAYEEPAGVALAPIQAAEVEQPAYQEPVPASDDWSDNSGSSWNE